MPRLAIRKSLIDATVSIADSPCLSSSLPPAGFCLYRAYDLHRAIGILTTHRAGPSWT